MTNAGKAVKKGARGRSTTANAAVQRKSVKGRKGTMAGNQVKK